MSNNRPDDLQTYFKKRGIKTRAETREPVSFIGKNARTTFTEMSLRQAAKFTQTNTDVAKLGEAYTSLVYEKGSKERDYEPVYGSTDYRVPVEQDPTTKEVLDEVFGNNDNDPTGEAGGLSESGVKTSLSNTGTTKNALRSLIEVHSSLYQSQTLLAGPRDEETVGIRAVQDIGSPIEPIA